MVTFQCSISCHSLSHEGGNNGDEGGGEREELKIRIEHRRER